jgi:hypothetical protein
MTNSFKRTIRFIALALAILMTAAVFGACKLTDDDQGAKNTDDPLKPEKTQAALPADLDGTKVVMTSKHIDMTLFDFGQSFYNSQYYAYYMYGMIGADQFYDAVVDEMSGFMRILNAAIEEGVELDEEELANVDSTIDEQLEQVLTNYESNVPEGAENVREEAKKLLEADLASDGISFDDYIALAKQNFKWNLLANKYYNSIVDSIEIDDAQINDYILENLEVEKGGSMEDFVEKYTSFVEGTGASPIYVPQDCFTVNHIYMGFESETDEQGNSTYDKASRADDEARLEALFPDTESFEEFMLLEEEYGEDPGMDSGEFRESGYLIHPDLIDSYYEGFVVAAMNLIEENWTPESGEAAIPELWMFTLKDGTRIVKVYSEYGVHYLILNQEIKEGAVEYTVGDERWESWHDAVANIKVEDAYRALDEQWAEQFPITVDDASIKAKYMSE